jgi:hypothetical protein
VSQAIEERWRALIHIRPVAIRRIVLQHRDDLVIGLTTIDHPQAADRDGTQQDVSVADWPLRQHTHVHRVTVADDVGPTRAVATRLGHPLTTQGLRQQSVKRRTHAGVLLRAIDLQMPSLSSSYLTVSVGTIST